MCVEYVPLKTNQKRIFSLPVPELAFKPSVFPLDAGADAALSFLDVPADEVALSSSTTCQPLKRSSGSSSTGVVGQTGIGVFQSVGRSASLPLESSNLCRVVTQSD